MLGRAQLKQRIEALETEVAELREQRAELEKEAERLRERAQRDQAKRREAVTARQDAQEQTNRLQERIAQLEGELERLGDRDPDERDVSYRHRERLSERRLAVVLDRLRSLRAGPEGALTAAVHDEVPPEVAEVLGPRAVLAKDAAPCIVVADDAGLVSVALRPPLPPALEPTWGERFILDPEWFEPNGRFLLALVRSDLFAAGVYDAHEQVTFKGFTHRVGRHHTKGGFSQGRFERGRDERIADHFKSCREALAQLRGEAKKIYLVGQREALEAMARDFEPDASVSVDATGAPREALEDAFRSFWTTELRVL